jgi:hypothetical protein
VTPVVDTSGLSKRLSAGVIGGIVAGAGCALLLIGLSAFLFFRRKTSVPDDLHDNTVDNSVAKSEPYPIPGSRGINQGDLSNWGTDHVHGAGADIPGARLGGNMESLKAGNPEGVDKEIGGRVNGKQ